MKKFKNTESAQLWIYLIYFIYVAQDYRDLLGRITRIPGMIDNIIELLRMGMEKGVTYAKQSLNGVDGQLDALQVQVGQFCNFIRPAARSFFWRSTLLIWALISGLSTH